MKWSLLVLMLLCAANVLSQNERPKLDDLKWFAGCWQIDQPERKRLVSEQWMSPVGNAMMGMSRTVRDGKMTGFEFLRIVDDGTAINYISKPSENKEETAFTLTKWSPTEAVFENPTHDFPQRIIYRLTKPDSLAARIEGAMNGQQRGVDFPFVRVKCGS